MAEFESNRIVVVPTVTIAGTQIDPSDESTSALNAVIPNQVVIDDKTVIKQEALIMQGTVTVTMAASGLTLKSYEDYDDSDSLTFIGKFEDENNIDKAEIRYTVNGKDPSRTKYQLYKGSFVFKSNKSGGDNLILKARTYYQGRWSDVYTAEIRIKRDSDLTIEN